MMIMVPHVQYKQNNMCKWYMSQTLAKPRDQQNFGAPESHYMIYNITVLVYFKM